VRLTTSTLALALGLASLAIAIARSAVAGSETCHRGIDRYWQHPPGQWVYLDNGCPSVTCDGGASDVCTEDFVIGSQWYACECSESGAQSCTPEVHYGQNGPDAARCRDNSCTLNCDPVWTPQFGQIQHLQCPCQ
jgi:hypothetical protein